VFRLDIELIVRAVSASFALFLGRGLFVFCMIKNNNKKDDCR
jgi:hypothetical protein